MSDELKGEWIDRLQTREAQLKQALAQLKQVEETTHDTYAYWDCAYYDLVKVAALIIFNRDPEAPGEYYHDVPPDDVKVIESGSYQGVLLFIAPLGGAGSASEFAIMKVYYGSCSACDALLDVLDEEDDEAVVNGLYKLVVDFVRSAIVV